MPKALRAPRARPSPAPIRPAQPHHVPSELTRFPGLSIANKPPPSLPALLDWLKQNGVVHSTSIEIRSAEGDDTFGWSAWACQDADDQDEEDADALGHGVACKIPRTAILSTRNSDFVARVLRSIWKQIPPIAQLSLVLLYELRQWTTSRWHGYLQSLPREPVPLATLWDLYGQDGQRGLQGLAGTSIERERKRIKREGHGRQDLETYFEATKAYFAATEAFPGPPTLVDLLHCYSLVSSRAFQIDRYHGTAMVPLADIFNHTEAADLAFESDDFCCDECGSLPACEHDEDVETAALGDQAVHVAPRFAHLPLEVIHSLSNPLRDCLDMTLQRTLRPGQQVWNSYGEHLPWSKTLAEWGFIDDASEVCRVYWEARDILDKDDEHYDARRSVWKKACGQADVDATCIDETGAVAPPLTYLVRVANLSEDELGDKKAAAAKIIARSAESDAPSRLLLRRLISDRLAQHEKLKPSLRPGPLESLAWKLRKREMDLMRAALLTLE